MLGGDVDGLLSLLTAVNQYDPKFMPALLLTYRSITSPSYLLNFLTNRYNSQPSEDKKDSAAYIKWFESQQKITRLRVCNTLKHWLKNHFYDFASDPSLHDSLVEFVSQMDDSRLKQTFQSIIDKKVVPTNI